MNRLLPALLPVLLGLQATVSPAQSWWSGPENGGCFGGRECSRKGYLEIRLESAPVLAVRFFAHDDIGERTDGRLRVRIDDRVLERDMPMERGGRSYLLDGHQHRGRFLIFEALTDDEVVVDDIEIEYADRGSAASLGDNVTDWQDGSGGWSRYRRHEVCIGGSRCSEPRLEVRLLDDPIRAVRFFAHDDVGVRRKGRLRVTLDHDELAARLNIEKRGRTYHLKASGQYARYLVIEPVNNDEVVIESLEVQYARRTRGPRPEASSRRDKLPSRPYNPQHCIGGRLCGDRYTLEVPVENQLIEGIRFFAHSDVSGGYRARLSVSLDRQTVGEDLSVPRAGDFFQIAPSEPIEGSRYLIFEAVGSDEVVVEDIEINYRGSWVRHRIEVREGPR